MPRRARSRSRSRRGGPLPWLEACSNCGRLVVPDILPRGGPGGLCGLCAHLQAVLDALQAGVPLLPREETRLFLALAAILRLVEEHRARFGPPGAALRAALHGPEQ